MSNENKILKRRIRGYYRFLIKLHNLAPSAITYISTYVPWQIDAFGAYKLFLI